MLMFLPFSLEFIQSFKTVVCTLAYVFPQVISKGHGAQIVLSRSISRHPFLKELFPKTSHLLLFLLYSVSQLPILHFTEDGFSSLPFWTPLECIFPAHKPFFLPNQSKRRRETAASATFRAPCPIHQISPKNPAWASKEGILAHGEISEFWPIVELNVIRTTLV